MQGIDDLMGCSRNLNLINQDKKLFKFIITALVFLAILIVLLLESLPSELTLGHLNPLLKISYPIHLIMFE
jgi:hypothetical protein